MLAPMKNGERLSPKFKMYPFMALVTTVAVQAAVVGFTDTSLGRYVTHSTIQLLKQRSTGSSLLQLAGSQFGWTLFITICSILTTVSLNSENINS